MAAYTNVPDEYLGCLISRRHAIPWAKQQRQKVRLQYGNNKRDTLDLIEYRGTCTECGTERVMLRTAGKEDEFVAAEYHYPDGYLAPKGEPWDREELRAVWFKRHPVTGRVLVIQR
jgi:5-methylcytosine-specific restriction endonuclease McrA